MICIVLGVVLTAAGLDFETESKTVVAADSENDIWEIDDDPRV